LVIFSVLQGFIADMFLNTLKFLALSRSYLPMEYMVGRRRNRLSALKSKLISPPILRVAQPDRAFRIEADTSEHAMGTVLLQQYNDRWLPAAYSSRKLTQPETRYPVHKQELLGLITASKI
jgi:hypothetical protein